MGVFPGRILRAVMVLVGITTTATAGATKMAAAAPVVFTGVAARVALDGSCDGFSVY
jgi:ABC-type uncharacterized transport system substrate-binding protein